MISVSSAMASACNKSNTRYDVKAKIKGHTDYISKPFDDVAITMSSSSTENMTIGNACASSISFSIKGSHTSLLNKIIEVEVGVLLQSGEYEYIQYGTYKITDENKGTDEVTYTGYDAMVYLMSKKYKSLLSFPASTNDILAEISENKGLEFVKPSNFTNFNLDALDEDYTYRDIIGFIAGLEGCNAFIDNQNRIVFRLQKVVASTTFSIDDERIYENKIESNQATFTYEWLQCYIKDNEGNEGDFTVKRNSEIDPDNTTGTVIENPYVTNETRINSVYNKIKDIEPLNSFNIEMLGDCRIQPCDVITVSSKDAEGQLTVMQLTHKFDGGLVTTVKSFAKTSSTSSLDTRSTTTRLIDRENKKLVQVTKTADKINWIVQSGTSKSDMVLTSEFFRITSDNIELNGNTRIGSGFVLSAPNIDVDSLRTDFLYVTSPQANLLKRSQDFVGWDLNYCEVTDGAVRISINGSADKVVSTQHLPIKASTLKNKKLTIAWDMRTDNDSYNKQGTGYGFRLYITLASTEGGARKKYHSYIDLQKQVPTEWTRFSKTFDLTDNFFDNGSGATIDDGYLFVEFISKSSNVPMYMRKPKLEIGSYATTWTDDKISGTDIYTTNTTTIDGGKITTGSITASQIDVDNLFAQTIKATGSITGATLISQSSEYVPQYDSRYRVVMGENYVSESSKALYIARDYPAVDGVRTVYPFYVTYDGTMYSNSLTIESSSNGSGGFTSSFGNFYITNTGAMRAVESSFTAEGRPYFLFITNGTNYEDEEGNTKTCWVFVSPTEQISLSGNPSTKIIG